MHSAFYQTPLDIVLRHLGVSSLIFTGLTTNSCILCSAHDAKMRDYRIIVAADCCAARSEREHNQALEHIRGMADAKNEESRAMKAPDTRAGQTREVLSNAEIADRLASLARLMNAGKENPYKVKAYQRAAARLSTFSESIDELVREEADLTSFPGIGDAIAACIREIVQTGTLQKLERLRGEATPKIAAIRACARLDPKRVLRLQKAGHHHG